MLDRIATSGTTTPQPAILAAAPRCGARTRAGHACRSPAIHGCARCRMHGGRGSGAPRGNRNGWKHGGRSAGFRAVAAYLRASSRFLATARLARRASAAGGDAGLALRLALALRADLPALPRLDGGARVRPAPRGAGAPPENRKSDIQPHAPGVASAALPPARPSRRSPRDAGQGNPPASPSSVRTAIPPKARRLMTRSAPVSLSIPAGALHFGFRTPDHPPRRPPSRH